MQREANYFTDQTHNLSSLNRCSTRRTVIIGIFSTNLNSTLSRTKAQKQGAHLEKAATTQWTPIRVDTEPVFSTGNLYPIGTGISIGTTAKKIVRVRLSAWYSDADLSFAGPELGRN